MDGSCVSECEAGTYGTSSSSISSNTNTASADSATSSIADDASSDPVLMCVACHRDCRTCENGGEHQHCTSCADNLLMSPTAGCVADCPDW